MLEDEIFKKSKFDYDKLLKYGFTKEKDFYKYCKMIIDNTFEIIVEIKDSKIKGKVIDTEFNEEYLNYRVENQVGEFANTIKDEFINLLLDIRNNCCISNYFVSEQANRITNLIIEKYKDNPEFLWEDNDSGVFRNKINNKWYGIIMPINKNKIDKEDIMIDVMNVKLPHDKIDKLVNKDGFYRAYHMNKKYWITIALDNTITDEEIMNLIDESHNYTVEVNEWVIPANPKYWDIINCFNDRNIIEWKQPTSINLGDIVYIYVGSPYSSIFYKCKVIEKDIESYYKGIKSIMKIELVKRYPKDKYTFDFIKQYDLKAIRGARRMPIKLINKMKELDD